MRTGDTNTTASTNANLSRGDKDYIDDIQSIIFSPDSSTARIATRSLSPSANHDTSVSSTTHTHTHNHTHTHGPLGHLITEVSETATHLTPKESTPSLSAQASQRQQQQEQEQSQSINSSTKSNKSIQPTRNKRKCRFPGCPRTIKSQGHCQKHGAIVKKCKIPDCKKQAQGRHEGMCKRHWNAKMNESNPSSANGANGNSENDMNTTEQQDEQQQHPGQEGAQQQQKQQQSRGASIYDNIIPQSIAWRQGSSQNNNSDSKNSHKNNCSFEKEGECGRDANGATKHSNASHHGGGKNAVKPSSSTTFPSSSSTSLSSPSSSKNQMPLVEFLRSGLDMEPGWHRKQERMLRNPNKPLRSISEQLQPEEKQLILFETMLLSGTIYSSSNSSQQRVNKDLAHAWGREKGFHNLLVSQMCERRGDLSRKRRSDVGKSLSDKEKATFRTKLIKTRSEKRAKFDSTNNNGESGSNESAIQVEKEQQQQHHLQLHNPIFESKPLAVSNNHNPTHHTQQLSRATETVENGN